MRFGIWHSVRGKLCWCHVRADAEELPSRLPILCICIADDAAIRKVIANGTRGRRCRPRSECWGMLTDGQIDVITKEFARVEPTGSPGPATGSMQLSL